MSNGGELLEIGCSSGFMLHGLADEYQFNVSGIEPSGVFSEFLKMKGINVKDSLESYIEENPNSKFDLIMHFFVLEHIQDPVPFLKKSYDLLNENGVLVCEIPNANDPLRTLFPTPEFKDFYWSIAHPWYFTHDSIEFLLSKKCGFTNFEVFGDQRYDLGNHSKWMLKGKPGGQNELDNIFGEDFKKIYRDKLIQAKKCDTLIFKLYK